MKTSELEKLRYPIGHFVKPDRISDLVLSDWIAQLEALPVRLERLVSDLNHEQLETPYRPGGWTVRQLVHHISDSHHNCYIRIKWALTEDNPVIKPYNEKAWAELVDSRTADIRMSLKHLEAVHAKLVFLLKVLSRDSLQRQFIHPDGNKHVKLIETIGHYAWHGNHHFTHIKNLLERKGWLVTGDKILN